MPSPEEPLDRLVGHLDRLATLGPQLVEAVRDLAAASDRLTKALEGLARNPGAGRNVDPERRRAEPLDIDPLVMRGPEPPEAPGW